MEPSTRSKTYPHYAVEVLLLFYGLYGAFTGSLTIPSKPGSSLVIHGWSIWLACLFPIFLAISTFLMIDPVPKKTLSEKQRLTFFFLTLLAAAGSFLVAYIYGA